MSEDDGWSEYSRLVLKELETLASGIESLRKELQEVKQELVEIKVKEDKVQELKQWKEKIDDIASPSQLKDMVKEIEDLKIFKTKAVTVFAVVQFLMAAVMFGQTLFK